MSWIKFEPTGCSKSGKTKVYEVIPKDGGGSLGRIAWYAPWHKYAFFPSSYTIFEQDCLRDIADFCERQTFEHKNPMERLPT